ncbi:MAG: DUF1961 family protein, partial [Archaeoglobaceae archaeon]
TDDWVWDGEGEVEHRDDGVLNVHTTGRTVYWAPVMLDEPVVIDFEAKTDNPRTRAILFFMAAGLNGQDIFTWKRTGPYAAYAHEERMELYTVGLLREGCGTESNFRFLGGKMPEELSILKTPRSEIADEQVDEYKAAAKLFQPLSITGTTTDGYTIGKWMHYQVVVDGGLIRVFADGRLLHEVTGEGKHKDP